MEVYSLYKIPLSLTNIYKVTRETIIICSAITYPKSLSKSLVILGMPALSELYIILYLAIEE
jgi:hypothetical protein